MYARIARFEGGDPGRIDAQVAEIKMQMQGAKSGELPADAPEGVKMLMETVSRFMHFVDRQSGTSVGIAFCETEEKMERAHAALNQMSPEEGSGRRTSAEVFELALDESFA
ncbi:MAG: hypothetical protein OEW52_13545 [Thermoleophilia bacterium]|nr:hypothetical protein [Thermoleophilia bacterium]MDH4340503.1 hypothetical protein [Thermoleophilia bacterium]MDH5282144.1 hypothetical protein [Thermoleophilia bacterium]